MIEELEEGGNGDGAKEIIINVATKYHLASKYTSFVGVDAECAKENFQAATKIEIANQVPHMYRAVLPIPLDDVCEDLVCYEDDDDVGFMLCDELYASPPPSLAQCDFFDPPPTKYDSAPIYDSQPIIFDSKATPHASPKDDLTLLLDQQSFEGAFAWSIIFQKLTGKTKDEIQSSKPTELKSFCQEGATNDESATTTAATIWLTAIAIQLMKLKM